MVIELCRCGWDIPGVDRLPVHHHDETVVIRRWDGTLMTVDPRYVRIDPGWDIAEPAEERLVFHVDWRAVYRAISNPTALTSVP